ncbi:MAG TPA: ABC transporter ATP-binding protein [bacterium]|nr:ABC transporter ATP-binding protein [bacterium]
MEANIPNTGSGRVRAIETDRVVKTFGPVRALRGVNLAVESGESLVIFGPNGAGKTTLLKIIATLSRPTSGTLRVFGSDPFADGRLRRTLGVVSHHSYLYGGLTAVENLVFAGRLYGVPDARARADALLATVGLAGRGHDLVRTFSRGMTQRLTIARALMHDPPILLLDEPYTGLDRHAAGMLTALLERLRGFRTVVMTTHSIEQGLALADRMAILVNGILAYQGTDGLHSAQAAERLYLDCVGGNGSIPREAQVPDTA